MIKNKLDIHVYNLFLYTTEFRIYATETMKEVVRMKHISTIKARPAGVHLNIQPLQSLFGLYRQFTITKAAEECERSDMVKRVKPECTVY